MKNKSLKRKLEYLTKVLHEKDRHQTLVSAVGLLDFVIQEQLKGNSIVVKNKNKVVATIEPLAR